MSSPLNNKNKEKAKASAIQTADQPTASLKETTWLLRPTTNRSKNGNGSHSDEVHWRNYNHISIGSSGADYSYDNINVSSFTKTKNPITNINSLLTILNYLYFAKIYFLNANKTQNKSIENMTHNTTE